MNLTPTRAPPACCSAMAWRSARSVRFGAYVVVHAGTVVGAGCVIEDHAVLGKRPRLSRSSSAKGRWVGWSWARE